MTVPVDLLAPQACCLLVVDVQNDFCHEQGALAASQDLSGVRATVPAIQALIDTARQADVPRIYARVAHSEWFDNPVWRSRGRAGTTLDANRLPVVQEGTWGAEFYELSPAADELVITKHRYSAFAYTPLELALQSRQASTLVLAGTQTNVCIEATAVDALQRGFVPVVVSDCVATGVPELHHSALRDIEQRVGPVVTLQDVQHAWVSTPAVAARQST